MDEREPLRQPIPLARSILWAPVGASRPGTMPFPVFLSQSALQAVHEHLTALPPVGQGILGFLLGDRCECPVTGTSYVVIDAALRLTQTIYSDRSRDVVTRLWDRLSAQVRGQEAQLIGWYHTHAPLPLELSAHDVETHEQHFRDPWQVSVLLGTDPDQPSGAFFRRGDAPNWVRSPQPFYELLSDESIRPGGKKRSYVTWKNYRAYNPPAARPRQASLQPPPPPPPPPPPQQLAPLEEPAALFEEDEDRAESRPVEEQAVAQEPDVSEEEQRQASLDEAFGDLKFLSAAEDAPPPPPSAPAAPADEAAPEPTAMDAAEAEAAPEEWPEETIQEPAAMEPEPVAPKRARRERRARGGRRRLWVVALGLVVLAAAGVGAWKLLPGLLAHRSLPAADRPAPRPAPVTPAPAPAAPPPPAAAPPPNPALAGLDRASDSLARAVQAYAVRARLFETRRLDCLPLARGLLAVEHGLQSYGAQRDAVRGGIDPVRMTRDSALRAAADSVERRFQRSQCTRS
jgi:proteasome lid subunit RPN8/RPN11